MENITVYQNLSINIVTNLVCIIGIHQKLFERCGQTTYLVERKVNGIKRRCILKNIECRDENYANQAYREVLRQKINLEDVLGIIPVKEFRVYWEAKNSSVEICCLRDPYDESLLVDLQRAYIDHSKVKEKIAENYMCQLILTLEKCHQRNVYHRALKMSNVVKDEKFKCLLIVDFLIDGTFQANHEAWQAPELSMNLQEPPDNEKIDVWGIGAVMLCIVCSIFIEPGEKFEEFLKVIKTSQNSLDELWSQLSSKYTQEILIIIRKMIDIDPKQRPTIKALKQNNFLEMSFKINDIAEIHKEYRKSGIGIYYNIPKLETLEPVIEFLATFIDSQDRVSSTINALNKLFIYQNSLDLKPAHKQLLLNAMKNHPKNSKIQLLGFQLLLKFVSKHPKEDYLFSCQAVSTVISILEMIPKTGALRSIIYEFLTFLALSDDASKSFGSHGGLQILIEMMREDKEDAFLLQKSSHALWGLCIQDYNARIAACEDIPADMCSCLNMYFGMPVVAKELIAVLLSLSIVPNIINVYCKHHVIHMIVCFLDNNRKENEAIALCCNTLKSFLDHATFLDDVMVQFQKNEVLSLLVSILWENIESPGIIKHCLTVLTAMVFRREECGHFFLIIVKGDANKNCGMLLIRKILNAYKNNARVARVVCNFLDVLTNIDEGIQHAIVFKISNWLTTIKTNFSEDKDLCDICENILKKMEKVDDSL